MRSAEQTSPPRPRALAVALALSAVVLVGTGCGGDGDDDTDARDKGGAAQEGNGSPPRARDTGRDAELFIQADVNRKVRRDGLPFRVRSVQCSVRGDTGECSLRGNNGRTYDVQLDIDPGDGSYVYDCRKCP